MFKKVTSAVLAMFVCFCAIGFIGSASNERDGLPPGRQRKKWAEYKKRLAKQQNNQSNNKKWGKNSNDVYVLGSEEEKEEQLQEDEDLDDMRTKAVREKRKK